MLSLLLNKIWGYVLLVGGAVVAILIALGIARRAGAKAEQAAETEKALQQSKDANAIDTEVHNLPQSELDKRLRDSQRD